MDRAADLKTVLVEYASTPGFAGRLSQAMDSASGHATELQDQFSEAVESLLYQPGPDGREPLLDRYLRTNRNIAPEDRRIYEDWRDRNVYGVFRVDARRGAQLTLHNLIDELEYEAYATVGAEAISVIKRRGFIVTRLVPIEDVWTISGNLQMYGPENVAAARALAASLLQNYPTLSFHNPAKAEQGRKTVARYHAVFLDCFGSHVTSGTGTEMITAYRAFLDACNEAMTAGNPEAGALARSAEQLAPDGSFPPELTESDDVGLYHHPVKGLSFLVHYRLVEDAHRNPPTDADSPAAFHVLGYVEDPSIPAYVLEDLAEKYPSTVDSLYRTALSSPGFNWKNDGEKLLRRHKPESYRNMELPGIAVVPDFLLDAYQQAG